MSQENKQPASSEDELTEQAVINDLHWEDDDVDLELAGWCELPDAGEPIPRSW